MLAKELSNPASPLPEHIAFYSAYVGLTLNNQSDFAGFLGGRYEPINILSRLSPEAIQIPASLTSQEDRQRHALRTLLSQRFRAERQRDVTLASYDAAFGRVRNLGANEKLFDISDEPEAIRQSYGDSLFAQQAIVARRLVEAGVPFVRLNRGWWDSHGENFDIHAALVPDLDKVMSALLDDLDDRGMLDHTLVVTFAEMGRTPKINNMRGRDHWGRCWSAALSGCGIKGCVVYGSTNADGTDVAENPVSAAEFFATVFRALGIDHQKQYTAPDGRPVTLTPYDTVPVKEVLA
jgi:arylsulfatase A-like enzyme